VHVSKKQHLSVNELWEPSWWIYSWGMLSFLCTKYKQKNSCCYLHSDAQGYISLKTKNWPTARGSVCT